MITKITDLKLGKWLPIGALATSLLFLAGCSEDKQQQQQQMPPPAVSVFNVADQKVGEYYEFVARSEAIDVVDIRARVEGFLVERNFTEGGMVKKDQLLFEIDRAPFEAALRAAEAQLASSEASLVNARKTMVRSRDLLKKGAISQADFDTQTSSEAQAAAAVEVSEANLETARINLGYTRITAPFKGEIGKSTYSVGNLVGPTSQPLATLTSMDPIYVTFQVDERQLISYMMDSVEKTKAMQEQKAEQNMVDEADLFRLSLKLPNGQPYNQPGTFRFADTQVDETTGTLTLRASFPNPDGIILPGLYLTLEAESSAKTLLPTIPQAAVQQNQSGHFVLVVKPDNTVEAQKIVLGRRIGPMWVVTKGLKAGEQVIVQGLQKVRPGAPVSPSLVTVDPVNGTITGAKQGTQKQGQ